MYNLNSIVNKKNLATATENDLRFNVAYHTPAVSPRGWVNNSTLVTNTPVTNDIITQDVVIAFDTQDAYGNDINVRDFVEAYAAKNGLDIDNLVWVSVYRFTKDGEQLYSPKKHSVGQLIGFLCEDREIAYKRDIQEACNKTEASQKIQAKMNKELSLLNQWISGGFIRISVSNLMGKEVASIENITNVMHVNDHLAQLMPDKEAEAA